MLRGKMLLSSLGHDSRGFTLFYLVVEAPGPESVEKSSTSTVAVMAFVVCACSKVSAASTPFSFPPLLPNFHLSFVWVKGMHSHPTSLV